MNAEIRANVRTLYDMQKLRTGNGNRICAAFRDKLGLASSDPEETEEKAEKILTELRAEYKRITDGVKRLTIKTKIDSKIITNYGELKLISGYEQMLDAENDIQKAIEFYLKKEPIFTEFLDGVKGCGTLMSGVILSEIDIKKCNSISALHKYAGLDVVVTTDTETGEFTEEGRCRKKHHLTPKTYTTRDGEIKETVGITFNPFLKTKMVGVLGSSFIKLKDSPYRAIYDGYKFRLQTADKHQHKSKGHIHNMAVRYMIKEFLADLWRVWRELEGLPVRPRYHEEKLGITHSKLKDAA